MKTEINTNLIGKSERLYEAVAYIKLRKWAKTQKEIAKDLEIDEANLSKALNGNENYITDSFLKKLAIKYNLSENWLITGKGNMLVGNNYTENTEILTGYYLPEVSASAGLETSINNDELKKIPVTIPGWEKDIIFINVFGDSMYPKYNSGEVIGVKFVEFQYLNYGHPYVVVFEDGEVFIKIVQPGKDEDHLVLESVNSFYKPKEFHRSLMRSFYSIKGVIKKEMM